MFAAVSHGDETVRGREHGEGDDVTHKERGGAEHDCLMTLFGPPGETMSDTASWLLCNHRGQRKFGDGGGSHNKETTND
jgi:hypothetical protein